MLVAHHFRMDARKIKMGVRLFATTSDDDLSFCRLAEKCQQDRFDGQQLQVRTFDLLSHSDKPLYINNHVFLIV